MYNVPTEIWGPGVWQALISCAWHLTHDTVPVFERTLRDEIPALLPCRKCRQHYQKNYTAALARSKRRARRQNEQAPSERALDVVWCLKDAVNASLNVESAVSIGELATRCRASGAPVDDVLLADALVFMAVVADKARADIFVNLCESLSTLLPLPHDSQFGNVLASLQVPRRDVTSVAAAVRAATAARTERGLPVYTRTHYLSFAEEEV